MYCVAGDKVLYNQKTMNKKGFFGFKDERGRRGVFISF